jgi:hypothetical protein
VISARRVQVTAAFVAAARTAFARPRSGSTRDEDATLPLPALGVYPPRSLLAGAARGLVVTPWFAAATGFVVAAALWIYMPHAEFRFPSSAVGVVPCQPQACNAAAGQGGAPTTTGRQPIASSGKTIGLGTGQPDPTGRTAAYGLKFSYAVIWQGQDKFEVKITITGRHALRAWKLAFAMPGDQISVVVGAAWRPSGTDGGIASAPSDSSPGAQSSGDHSDSGGSNAHERSDVISFQIFGEGTPVMPTGCQFDGANCTFSSELQSH